MGTLSALSTAFRPFTPTAPPDEELMVSQPGPCGEQLTVGIVTPEPPLLTTRGDGKAFTLEDRLARPIAVLLGVRDAVEGVW